MSASANKPNSVLASQVDLRCFAIVLVPVVIVATHKFIGDHLMPGYLNVSDEILKDGQDWLEVAGRYRLLAATCFFGALSVLSTALLFRLLMRPMTFATRTAAIVMFLFVPMYAALPALSGGVRRMRTSLRYPNPTFRSGSEKAAPKGESGGEDAMGGKQSFT